MKSNSEWWSWHKIMYESCLGNFFLFLWLFNDGFFFFFLNNDLFSFFLLLQRLLQLNLWIEVNIFFSQFSQDVVHQFFVLFKLFIIISLGKSLFDLFFQLLSESVGWVDEEMVESGCHGALVGQESGDFTFVLSNGSTDKGSVV